MREKISVVLCVYNAEKYIKECLCSIEMQSVPIYELIIVNDGSTDQSRDIIQKFIKNTVISVTYMEHKNVGLTKSLNIALACCTGDYVARMDADDISHPNRLEKSLHFLRLNKLDFISTQALRFDKNGLNVGVVPRIYRDLYDVRLALLKFGNPFIHGTFFFKRSILNDIKYNENFRTAQDYDFLCQLLTKGYKAGYLSEVLYKLRIVPESSGRKKGSSQVKNAQHIAKYYFGTEKFLLVNYGGGIRLLMSLLKRLYYL